MRDDQPGGPPRDEPAGIGLAGVRPTSRGASTRSLRDPIEAWSDVMASPSRTAVATSAPAIAATIADDQAVEQAREGMGQPDQTAERARRASHLPRRREPQT